MALGVLGDLEASERAYDWLATHQLGEGAWFNYYRAGTVDNPRLDSNVSAYVAVGVHHFAELVDDVATWRRWWPMVERALSFAVSLQRRDGTVAWARDASGRLERDALVTGCSSLLHSLECGVALGRQLDASTTHWSEALVRLRRALERSELFADKSQFAMDWYYPALSGALAPAAAEARLRLGEGTFVREGEGVRCVSTSEWVTAAETAECALAWALVGHRDRARDLLECTRRHRLADGSYLTGLVEPGGVSFPAGERTTYSAAAVVLADDALYETSSVRRSFRPGLGESLEDA